MILASVLQFVDEEATDDVASISSYLSDADCLLGGEGSMRSRRGALNFSDVEPSQVAYAAASSVAARGVLFSNVHPAPPRFVIYIVTLFQHSFAGSDDSSHAN